MKVLFYNGFNMKSYKDAVHDFFNNSLEGKTYLKKGYILGNILENPLIEKILIKGIK